MVSNGCQQAGKHLRRCKLLGSSGYGSGSRRYAICCSSVAYEAECGPVGTWHEGRGSVDATYNFVGTGVAAYFINSNRAGAITNMSFFIDGEMLETYAGAAIGATDTASYNVVGFSTSNLANVAHQLRISQVGGSSALMLDYLTYDEVDGQPSETPSPFIQATLESAISGPTDISEDTEATQASSNLNPLETVPTDGTARPTSSDTMAAAAVGAVVGTLALLLAVEVYLRVRRKRRAQMQGTPLPFNRGE